MNDEIVKNFNLAGRVAVVTGAASGIGKSTALVLAGAGAAVACGDIAQVGAEETVKEIEAAGGRAFAQRSDVTSRADVDSLVDGAADRYGRLDIVANIAGVPHDGKVVDITDDEFDRMIAINVKSVLFGCQAALRHMIPQGSGNIVNIASGAIDTPAPKLSLYGMTKAAVAMLTKDLATEVGHKGIRVNALAPGLILTSFSSRHFTDDEGHELEDAKEAFKERSARYAPLGRVGEPEDVAYGILYLVSDAGSFVTGQILRPNGGIAMPW